jgi:hypothetical protein
MLSESPIARIVLKIIIALYTHIKTYLGGVFRMEKVEIPRDTVEQESVDDLKAILDKFEFMPDFVPSRKELFGIGNASYSVERKKQNREEAKKVKR